MLLGFPGAAQGSLEEESARLLALADEDTAWVQANASDTLDHEASLADQRPANRQLRRMRGVMIENGHADRALWTTEWGFPSGTCGYTKERQDELSALQADYLSRLPYVSHALWFNPRDTPGTDRWAYIGTLRTDWSRKPVFATLAALE